MPIKRVLISLAVGMVSLFIVILSGLTSEIVRTEIIASRAFSAFSFATLASFILMMCGEEYAIFKTDKELENIIDEAQIEELDEEFNKEEYLREDDEEILIDVKNQPAVEIEQDENFRSVNFDNLPNQN